jgi:pimeloyl-ACP methyl ester carboxylesterase
VSDRRHRLAWAELGGAAALAVAGAAVQRRHLRRIAADPEQAILRSPPSGQPLAIRSADGTQLHAECFGGPDDAGPAHAGEAGSAPGQTFVLAHGWTEMLLYWIYVIRELSERGFRVVAYDLRGHGQSQPAAGGDYSLARFGEDLEAVLEAAVPVGQQAVVVGHSLGAMSIAAWAEHHDVQRRVCGAALLNTGVGDVLAEQLLIPLPLLAAALNRIVTPAALVGSRASVPRFSTPLSQACVRYVAFGPAATPAQIAFYERMLVSCPPDVRADVGITISEMDLRDAVPRLTVPTLVVAGERDRLTPPSHAKRIADALPRLQRLIVLDATGHMSPLERPREVSQALLELAGAATGAAPVAA